MWDAERELLIRILNYINAFMLHKKQQPQFSNAMENLNGEKTSQKLKNVVL